MDLIKHWVVLTTETLNCVIIFLIMIITPLVQIIIIWCSCCVCFYLTWFIYIVTYLTLISDLMEEEQHHVKTREKNCSQPESISLLKRRDKKSFTCTQCGRVSQTNRVFRLTWGSTLERNRSHVISAGWVSHNHQTFRNTWRSTLERNRMSSKYTTPPVKMIDWGAGLPV